MEGEVMEAIRHGYPGWFQTPGDLKNGFRKSGPPPLLSPKSKAPFSPFGVPKEPHRIFLVFLLLGVIVCIGAAEEIMDGSLPEWYIPLREAVYEQRLKADEILPLYREVKGRAEGSPPGAARFILLSRCEYMMGRAYLYEERKTEAAERFEAGMDWAEKSLEAGADAEGWRMLAENLSQLCTVKPVSFVMTNGLNVEKYSKKALELDPRNAGAQYMIAARWVFAPSPFNNFKRGIRMMEDLVTNTAWKLQKEDPFNACIAIGYAYVEQKKYEDAKPWLERALAIYPTNKYVRSLLEKNEDKKR
jgi:tetratricopeptide (TPR) repeat protein